MPLPCISLVTGLDLRGFALRVAANVFIVICIFQVVEEVGRSSAGDYSRTVFSKRWVDKDNLHSNLI